MATLVHQSLTNCQALPRHAGFDAAPQPRWLTRLAATLRLWHGRIGERRELALLGARDLRDIGASASDVWHEVRQPFWRSAPRR